MPYIAPNTNQFEVAKLLLDRFWQEIFWRRQNEQRIAIWTIGFFTGLLALVYGAKTPLVDPQKLALSFLAFALGCVAASYLFLNWRKDKEIASLIVRINDALGCWEEGFLFPGTALYPEKWRKWGLNPNEKDSAFWAKFRQDRASSAYFGLVIISTLVCIWGINAV